MTQTRERYFVLNNWAWFLNTVNALPEGKYKLEH